MARNGWLELLGVSMVGVMMLLTSVPSKTSGTANYWWEQNSGQDFAGDTMTNVHVCNVNPGFYFVHLEDNESDTYDFDYSSNLVPVLLWDVVSPSANVHIYSQSFTPDIDGVVDKVDLRVYRTGQTYPKTPANEDAKLIIRITDAVQSGDCEPIMNNVLVEWYFAPSQVPQNSGLYTYILTEYDSCHSTPLEAGTVYDLVVTTDADSNQQQGVGYFWDADFNQDTSGTDGCQKGYDQNNETEWTAISYDFPFKVYVHNFVHSGEIVSSVHNCGSPVTFSETFIEHREGGTLLFSVRAGPTSSPDGSWSDWVDQGYGSQNPGLDPNQYVQYKIEFVAGDDDLTTEGVCVVRIGWL
ncbi:MAG: hypothetical protein FJ149_12510 [Euryarchaeota archaeon]|nr:hypothetical protein [Euryarchaeota archaeon]